MDIGKIIKEYRNRNNMTQKKFGEKVGVNKQTVSKWENGILLPSAEKYYEIMKIEGILLEGDSSFVFENRATYNVGLNYLHQRVSDYDTLILFLDSFMVAYNLVAQYDSIGFVIINGTYESDINVGSDILETIMIYDDYIILQMPEYSVKLHKNDFTCIKEDGYFNNESYAITCYLKKNNDFFQLLISLQ